MQTITLEQVLTQINALPPADRTKLLEYLDAQQRQDREIEKAHALASAAGKGDLAAEHRWLEQHRNEYAGQWVTLKGEQLISYGPHGKDVHAAAVAAGHPDALLLLVEAKDDRPFVNI